MTLTKDDFLVYNERYEGMKPLFDEETINQILKNQEIIERLKKLNLKGHIIFLKHYIKSLPIAYDLAAIENILYDLKELQKILEPKDEGSSPAPKMKGNGITISKGRGKEK